jgi:hypothetical protein
LNRDPRRLIDDLDELSPDAMRALEAGMDESVPRGAKAAVWGAVSAALPKAAAAAAASGTAAGGGAAAASVTASAGLSLMKVGAIGALLGTVSSVGFFAVERATAPLPSASATASSIAPAVARIDAPKTQAERGPAPELPPQSEPVVSPPAVAREQALLDPAPEAGTGIATERTAALLGESQKLADARALLRAGAVASALDALLALERELPNGILAQERESLTIEALSVLGQRESAQRRAARFLARYPASPHAEAVRRVVQ